MKNLFTIAFSIMVVFSAKSQDDGGSNRMWIGGTGSYQSFSVKDGHDETSYQFGPSFGFMLNSNMALGINMMYRGSSHHHNDANEEVDENLGYNFEPFFRYYFGGNEKFKFFGDGLVSFGGGKTKYTDNLGNFSENKYSTYSIAVRPGFQYWFTDKWSIASTIGTLGYGSRTEKDAKIDMNGEFVDEVTTSFGVKVDFSTVNFSFFFHF